MQHIAYDVKEILVGLGEDSDHELDKLLVYLLVSHALCEISCHDYKNVFNDQSFSDCLPGLGVSINFVDVKQRGRVFGELPPFFAKDHYFLKRVLIKVP